MRMCLLLLVTLTTSIVSAQSMDIVEQDVRVDVVDTLRVEIDVTIRTETPTDVLLFPTFVSEITTLTVDGTDASFAPHRDYPDQVVEVTLPEGGVAGAEFEINIVMEGPVVCSRGARPGSTWCWHNADETILPGAGAAWYVSNLFQADAFVGSVEVRAPSDFVVYAGQGSATEILDEGATGLWRFDVNTATELLGLYAGTADVVTGEGFPFDVVHHADRDDAAKVRQLADLGAQLYPLYADYFGVLPTERAQIILVPRNFAVGGLGVMGSPFLGEYVVGEFDYLLEQGAGHELAHSWWGGIASAGIPSEGAFMQEAFAEYSAWRALGDLQGTDVRISGNRMNATFYMYRRPDDQDVAILAPRASEHAAYIHAAYHKGSQILRMLETRVGTEAFTAALQQFVGRGTGGLSVAGLVEEIEAASGENVRTALTPWLQSTGFPILTVSSNEVTMDGDYDLRIPIRETFSDGTQDTRLADLTSGDQTLDRSTSSVLLEVDPEWTCVREIRMRVPGDVTFDDRVDAADLMAIALREGTNLPETRRQDGGYDSLFDVDGDREVTTADLDAILPDAR